MSFSDLSVASKKWKDMMKEKYMKDEDRGLISQYLQEMAKSGWPMYRWLLLEQIIYELSLCYHFSSICRFYHKVLVMTYEICPSAPIPLFFLRQYSNYSLTSFLSSVIELFSSGSLNKEIPSGESDKIRKSTLFDTSVHCILLEEIKRVHQQLHADPNYAAVENEAIDSSLLYKVKDILIHLSVDE